MEHEAGRRKKEEGRGKKERGGKESGCGKGFSFFFFFMFFMLYFFNTYWRMLLQRSDAALVLLRPHAFVLHNFSRPAQCAIKRIELQAGNFRLF